MSWPIDLTQSCPRCGNTKWDEEDPDDSLWFSNYSVGCYKCNHVELRKQWNNRPVEADLRARCERAEAAAAEMREVLNAILEVVDLLDYDETKYWTKRITHALRSPNGTGWLSPEKVQRLREALHTYGDHTAGCQRYGLITKDKPCTCGFEQALSETESEVKS